MSYPLERQTSSLRRTALINYFDCNDDSFEFLHETTSSHPDIFALLETKFGFQSSSVANQKENLTCWIVNYQLRMGNEQTAWKQIHMKFFKNYRKWCTFLSTKPLIASENASGTVLQRDLALFLCIWGEAGNLRFMPECICFLYHSFALKMNEMERLKDVEQGYYLQQVVRPIYQVVSTMRTAGMDQKVDHQDITNYDDLNEFFWNPRCLLYDELNIGQALQAQEGKTFREKRSIFNPLLAFFRVWFFLWIMFHILIIISYVGIKTRENNAMGLQYYMNWFRTDQKDVRNHAILSLFLSISGLLTCKVVLQLWLFGTRIVQDIWLMLAIFCRLYWHLFFFGCFVLVWISPLESMIMGFKGTFLSNGYFIAGIYMCPVIISSILRMCGATFVWEVPLLNSLDGTRRQYVGREMSQPFFAWIQYTFSWFCIYFLKFIFTLELMIKPLVGPSLDLIQDKNIIFVLVLWTPILCVYMYDVQIWFTLYQSIIGLYSGLKQKMGSYTTLEEIKTALATAPEQFEKSMASSHMKTQKETRIRFAMIWNEIIHSFRLNDLLDDREETILQYRIRQKGIVQDPIFLLVGKIPMAIRMIQQDQTNDWKQKMQQAKVWDGVQDGLELVQEIMTLLLGNDGPLIVLEYIFENPFQCQVQHLPILADQMATLLSALLDLPDDSSDSSFDQQIHLIVESLKAVFHTTELFINNQEISESLHSCRFLHSDLTYQKKMLIHLTNNSDMKPLERTISGTCNPYARQDFISACIRLFLLLRLEMIHAQPRCDEARRRLSFFLHSMTMKMPSIVSISHMPSFSVMTPYYSETVLFTLDELKNPVSSNPLFEKIDTQDKDQGRTDLTIMGYLITFHAEEWTNFMERMNISTIEEAIGTCPHQVRLWASLRGQTLARTVYGMMMYEDALKLLYYLELSNETNQDEQVNHLVSLKFSYITGCQIYSQQVAKNDHRADDIDFLMKQFPSWRVSFVDSIQDRYDCVLVKAEKNEIVEVYRYELPGNPILGEGKPENQNVALPFTRGEYLQTIDMNQEHYFEETLKIPHFLATTQSYDQEVTIIGMKEHVFTGRASSLARFMTLQELVFVTLTQRVLAHPLRARMHYGHPDVFEKSFVMTNGGVSKASRGINLSEDVFSGYNVTLRGGLITHVEFMQCGKGRDVTLSQINAFEAKLSNGCAESCLSRDGHRMSSHLDFSRLNSMFFGHFGFYICNAMTVLCVYLYAYSKLYIATHSQVLEQVLLHTSQVNTLATVMGTQYLLQFGMLTTLPLLSTLLVEYGWKQALFQMTELFTALGIVFYVFLTGTKAHYYDIALIRGGSKYRGTGRGFSITRDPMVNFFKEYNISHFRKGVELICIMILFGVYGVFNQDVLKLYCQHQDCTNRLNIPSSIVAYSQTSQSYGIASFAVLLLGACWILAPFLFNTDGLVLEKTLIDIYHWFTWMMREECEGESIEKATPGDGWINWYRSDVDLNLSLGPLGRLTYCIREFRLVLAMYYVFTASFSTRQVWILFVSLVITWFTLWIIGRMVQFYYGWNQKAMPLFFRGLACMVIGIGSIWIFPLILGSWMHWSILQSVSLSASILLGLHALCQYSIALHGIFGFRMAMWSPFITIGFFHDMLIGIFLVVPLVLLSFLPFMRILQTRMLYNGGFSRALSSGSEIAASICILIGLVGGYIYGFMSCFVLNLNPSINPSFQTFLDHLTTQDRSQYLIDWVPNGQLKAIAALAGMIAPLTSLLFTPMMGRRMNMSLGCILVLTGMILDLMNSSSLIIGASCLITFGTGLLAVNYLLYAFEISAINWRGKSIVIFLIGSGLGFAVHSIIQYNWNDTNFSGNEWRLLPFYSVAPMALLYLVIMWFVPESPVWYFIKGNETKTKEILIRLRRRQNVNWDLRLLETERDEPFEKRNYWFRIGFISSLEMLLSLLMSTTLLKHQNMGSGMVNYGVFITIGTCISLFIIDTVRRKTILKDFLPLIAILSLLCGTIESLSKNGSLTGFLIVLFMISGMSLMSVTWLTALEMFGVRNRALFFSLSMTLFYLIQALVFYTRPSFILCHFIFGGMCALLTILIFSFCASTKNGAIQLKSEKKKQKEEEVQEREATQPVNLHTATYRQIRMMKRRQSVDQAPLVSDGNTQQDTMPSSPKDEGDSSVPYLLRAQSSFSSYSLNEDDFTGETENLMQDILHPIPQARSVSFLHSRTFPDAQVHAETRGRGVRL